MVDVARDARWGRVMEAVGEPFRKAVPVARFKVFKDRIFQLIPYFWFLCQTLCRGYAFAAQHNYNTVDVSESILKISSSPI
jgi:hypothetical protein